VFKKFGYGDENHVFFLSPEIHDIGTEFLPNSASPALELDELVVRAELAARGMP
jgi:hypothetical protein